MAYTSSSKSKEEETIRNANMVMPDPIDVFITKFLRSEKGYKTLKDHRWIDLKLEDWNTQGGLEYITKLERNVYEGLNMGRLNSLVATHSMSIWIPIYEHSSDLRSEINTIKKFPFQVMVRVEDMSVPGRRNLIEEEPLQTYIEISQESVGQTQ